MVEGRKKSRSFKRKKVRTPGGELKTVYTRKRPAKAQCANCGKYLAGVPRVKQTAMKKIPKSSRRPERPYGGQLCSICSRKEIIKKTRAKTK
jgi:large subunit ribosomal protein L34e